MSHNNSILNILRIKDKNIKIISVEEAEHSSSVTSSTISIFFWGASTKNVAVNLRQTCLKVRFP
ncbi:hypothetical protein FOL80_00795 [Lactobacillus reuteri]|uniref:Uncharacterized protein n=1 Tax=Limosilactobacillus reuteri TaxID=1598 RepID=A0A347T977_LIMRT|nr:hypothetical protein DL317_07045 [Limosilactobacillus reuteri]MRG69764.1 hypothetical protein [Limosilactobacillus reuteri]NMV48415.1 hypothetical protein [Limosilactobacillus reuteri]NMV50158.1 hypothetical protein [Limosilactobacillus reuteri]NMV54850.1 hypothetical protein [Limosilactobacillus reuteri]